MSVPDRVAVAGEEWLPVTDVGFGPPYHVSSLGRAWVDEHVRVYGGTTTEVASRARILSPGLHSATGVAMLRMHVESRILTRALHRLVCRAFHGPSPKGRHDVLFLDGDVGRPSANNVRWATRAESSTVYLPRRRALGPDGVVHEFANANAFCRAHGLNPAAFSRVLSGDAHHHHGFRRVPPA